MEAYRRYALFALVSASVSWMLLILLSMIYRKSLDILSITGIMIFIAAYLFLSIDMIIFGKSSSGKMSINRLTGILALCMPFAMMAVIGIQLRLMFTVVLLLPVVGYGIYCISTREWYALSMMFLMTGAATFMVFFMSSDLARILS